MNSMIVTGTALVIATDVGDRTVEGTNLNNIGAAYQALGQYDQALNNFQQALVIRREVGDRDGEGTILNSLGAVYQALGQFEKALDYCLQALVVATEIGNIIGQVAPLNNIDPRVVAAIEKHRQG